MNNKTDRSNNIEDISAPAPFSEHGIKGLPEEKIVDKITIISANRPESTLDFMPRILPDWLIFCKAISIASLVLGVFCILIVVFGKFFGFESQKNSLTLASILLVTSTLFGMVFLVSRQIIRTNIDDI